MEYIFLCPKCGSTYGQEKSDSIKVCSDCNVKTVFSGFTDEEWYNKSFAERNTIAADMRKEAEKQGIEFEKPIAPSAEAKGSMWIGMLDTILNAVIVLGILVSVIGGGILIGTIGFGGLLVMVLGVILTLLSVAVSKVLIGVASDIRTIRENTMR